MNVWMGFLFLILSIYTERVEFSGSTHAALDKNL